MSYPKTMTAAVDFDCIEPDCLNNIQFDLLSLEDRGHQVACSECRRIYEFDDAFIAKLDTLRRLVLTVQSAEDILSDCNVSVTTPAGEVKIPYRLLLTRLNTMISLKVEDRTIDFNFRVEPLNDGVFK